MSGISEGSLRVDSGDFRSRSGQTKTHPREAEERSLLLNTSPDDLQWDRTTEPVGGPEPGPSTGAAGGHPRWENGAKTVQRPWPLWTRAVWPAMSLLP